MLTGLCTRSSFCNQVNPMIGPLPQALLDAGALNSALVVEDGEW